MFPNPYDKTIYLIYLGMLIFVGLIYSTTNLILAR